MEGLREPQQKALDDCAVYYTEFEVPQVRSQKRAACSPLGRETIACMSARSVLIGKLGGCSRSG